MLRPEQVAKVILEAALLPAEKDVKELVISPRKPNNKPGQGRTHYQDIAGRDYQG